MKPRTPRTLRTRVLWLFTTLALAPFLVASVVQYHQAAGDGSRAAEALSGVVASRAFQEGERVYREASTDARSLTDHIRSGGDLADWSPSFPSSVRAIEVRDGAGKVWATWRNPSPQGARVCGDPGEVDAFAFAAPPRTTIDAEDTWVAVVSADPAKVTSVDSERSLLGAEGSVEIRDRDRGFLSSKGCLRASMQRSQAKADSGAGTGFDPEFLRTSLPLTLVPWIVDVSVDPASIGARTGTAAWFFAVAAVTALVATLLFTLLLSGVTRSLEHLAEAADRIGDGDFTPWLPPPGDDEAGRLSFAIGRMVDRIREMMEKVKRTGQMAAIGEMASYVAHEIRNPLNSLRLNLQSVERAAQRGEIDADDIDSLSICLREVSRLDRVVGGVLRVSKPDSGHVDLTSLHGVIRQAAELLADEIANRSIELNLRLAAVDDWIRADAQQIEAAIINLLLNAAEAIDERGTIEVSTRSVFIGEHPGVELVVTDSGPGIPVGLRPRIFEPFFTTKPSGSGLGLAVVMRTVEQHGGKMRLDEPSGLDQGAAFRIAFPTLPNEKDLEAAPRRWALTGLDTPRSPWARFPSSDLEEALTSDEDSR